MPVLKNPLPTNLLILLLLFFLSCQSKKKPLTGDELKDVGDFIEFFPQPVKTFLSGDTVLLRKEKDSAAISYANLIKFIPDSINTRLFGKGIKPKSYPLARMQDANSTHYLLTKTVAGENRGINLYCFDKSEKLIAAANLMKPDQSAATTQSVSIDRNFNISKTIARKNPDGSISEGKEVFILNESAQNLMLILTEQLDDRVKELLNPIDTFAARQKISADYSSGKNNLVSIRDGKKADQLLFFIHFEKNNGECNGELKGEAKMTGKNTAEYREGGDPCALQFVFTSGAVSLKELEGCAAHRGLRCSFDGSYARKRPAAKSKNK